MERLSEIWRRLLILFHWRRFNRDLEEEMRFHVEMKAKANHNAGMETAQARNAATRQFGNATLLREVSRETWILGWIDRLSQDLRFAIRGLRKKPGFSLIIILTLAIGIGANTAIFSVVNAVLLRPLPYRDPGRLVILHGEDRHQGFGGMPLSPNEFANWREQTTVFEQMAATGYASYVLQGPSEPEKISGSAASPNLFRSLGVQPIKGRAFYVGEESPEAPPVVILSYKLWQQRFGSDPAVLGKAVTLGSNIRTVVGIMPPEFHYPDETTQFWTPLSFRPGESQKWMYLNVVARLKNGATFEQARAEGRTISKRLAAQFPGTNASREFTVLPLGDGVHSQVHRALWVIFGAVGLVALIACANLADLLLARTSSRRREIAVRLALGVSQRRLIRHLLSETLLLAVIGGAVGLSLAHWGVAVLVALIPSEIPRIHEASVDGPVLAFAFTLSILTGVLVALAPALRASRLDPNSSLKESVRQLAGGFRGNRLRNVLVVAQIGLAMILLAGAGLLVRSFLAQVDVRLGFDPARVLAIEAESLPPGMLSEIIPRIKKLPGVVSAAAATSYPHMTNMVTTVRVEGRPAPPPATSICELIAVSSEYFSTLRIQLVKGRFFSEQDSRNTPRVAVINEATAHWFFSGEDPIGKRFLGGTMNEPITIVGVAKDVRGFGPYGDRLPAMYLLYQQSDFAPDSLMVRTTGDPLAAGAMVKNVIRAADKGLVITAPSTLEQKLSLSVATPRFYTLLLGIFAVLALSLALVGIYGVISYAVAQATQEIGIRMALGAGRWRVLLLVLRHSALLVAGGVVFGVAGAWGTTRALQTLLYKVDPADPITFVAVTVLLIVVALAACCVPALRATRIAPTEALRYE